MALFFRMSGLSVPCSESETARYAGYAKDACPDSTVAGLISASCAELQELIQPQAVYDLFPLCHTGASGLSFAGTTLLSDDLSRNLLGCSSVVLLAATIGPKADALIRRTQLISRAHAAVLQAAGAMFIESFVDQLDDVICRNAAADGSRAHPRYSPGYGDVPLSVQHVFFSLLPCSRIGLTLTEAAVMAPEKSVTAFIGLE